MGEDLLTAIVLILLFLSLLYFSFRLEKKQWNNGICKANGARWHWFAVDSSGARGYMALGKTCWISWHRIDGR